LLISLHIYLYVNILVNLYINLYIKNISAYKIISISLFLSHSWLSEFNYTNYRIIIYHAQYRIQCVRYILMKWERDSRLFTSLWFAFGRSHPEIERRRQFNGKKEFFGCFRRQVALSRANNSEDEIIKMGPRKTCQPWRTDRSRKRSPTRTRSRSCSHARISRTKLFYECWSSRVTRIMQSAPAESDNFYVFRVARRLVGPFARDKTWNFH